MIKVKVEYIGGLAVLMKATKEVVILKEGATVMDFVQNLDSRGFALGKVLIGEEGHIQDELVISVNGRVVAGANELRTRLVDGDRLVVFPLLEGG